MNSLLSDLDSLSSQIECIGKRGELLPVSEQQSYRIATQGEYSRLRTLFRIKRKKLAILLLDKDCDADISSSTETHIQESSSGSERSENTSVSSSDQGDQLSNIFTKIGGIVQQIFDGKPITDLSNSELDSMSGSDTYDTAVELSEVFSLLLDPKKLPDPELTEVEICSSKNTLIQLENIRNKISLMSGEDTENLDLVRIMMHNAGKMYSAKNDIVPYLNKIEIELNKLA